uniref:Interleukin 12 receptor subunit beta 1 n=1 Tax=Lepisosteus oculatus TaxID=7918 RepID=W5LZY7_LEPOC|nr:PREDICTED: interleukin-12 receptor subunit beta-1 [Lepisosteus oculatus]
MAGTKSLSLFPLAIFRASAGPPEAERAMRAAIVFTLLAVVVVEGKKSSEPHKCKAVIRSPTENATGDSLEAPSDLHCYKKTTDPNADFTCKWTPGMSAVNATYILHYCVLNKMEDCHSFDAGLSHSCFLNRDGLHTRMGIGMWVEAHQGYRTYKSPVFSVVLIHSTKYDPPQIEKMSRSSGGLVLKWRKQVGEDKGSMNEIQFRQLGELEWSSIMCNTSDGKHTEEKCTLTLHNLTVYEVRVRRTSKVINWSEWSRTEIVPAEIHKEPQVNMTVGKLLKGVRKLRLSLEVPIARALLGNVQYNLTFHSPPCQEDIPTMTLNATKITKPISGSEVKVSIVAFNKVGSSPPKLLKIPAVDLKDLHPFSFKNLTKNMKWCVEWYKATAPREKSRHFITRTPVDFKDMINSTGGEAEDFKLYYFIIHQLTHRGTMKTRGWSEGYQKEGTPRSSPKKVTVLNVTVNSAVVKWAPIPVPDQQGFLQHYVIYITAGNRTREVQVDASETHYKIQELTAATTYSVQIAGKTAAGLGPKSDAEPILTSNIPPTKGWNVIWITIAIAIFTLIFTGLGSFAAKRLKRKFFPAVPSPMSTEALTLTNLKIKEEILPQDEEVLMGDLQVVLQKSTGLPSEDVVSMELGETETCEGDTETLSESCRTPDAEFFLSSDYRRQMLNLPACEPGQEALELSENICSYGETACEVATPTYKNSLVFEMKGESNTSEESIPMRL